MTSPIATVEAFLARMADPGGFGAAVREWFTDATVYENIGMTRTTGIDEALAVVTSFEQGLGADSLRIDTLAIAATGSRVLTERIDHFVKNGFQFVIRSLVVNHGRIRMIDGIPIHVFDLK